MVTLTDLSPERLETKPTWVLRALRAPGVEEDMGERFLIYEVRFMIWRAADSCGGLPSQIINQKSGVSSGGGGRGALLVTDGLQPRDVFAQRAQLVRLLDLAGLLAH